MSTIFSSTMFSGCMLPVGTNLNKTFLQISRENDQARIKQFILPIERSVLKETSEIISQRGDMCDIWCPWENYSPDTQFIEEVSSLASIEETLKKYEKLSVQDLESNSIVPHCADVKEKMIELEVELSSNPRKLHIYDDSQPTIPVRPNVLNGELFPPTLGRKMEDIMKPEAKRLLDQLDNPEKLLSNLPPLPLPEWSNNVKRVGNVLKKMEADEGHIVMPGKEMADLNMFCTDFEEFVQQSRGKLYQTDHTVERDMWNLFKVEGLLFDDDKVVPKVVHEVEEKEDDTDIDGLARLFDLPSQIICSRAEDETAEELSNDSLLKDFDLEDENSNVGVRTYQVTESRTVIASILDHIVTSMFSQLDSESERMRYTKSSQAETCISIPPSKVHARQGTLTSSVNTAPELTNNLPTFEGLLLIEDRLVHEDIEKEYDLVSDGLAGLFDLSSPITGSRDEDDWAQDLHNDTLLKKFDISITITSSKGPASQRTPTSSVNTHEMDTNLITTMSVLANTTQPVTPLGIFNPSDLNPRPEVNIPKAQEKTHSQANNSLRLVDTYPTLLEHRKVESPLISLDTRDRDNNHLGAESASQSCQSPIYSGNTSQPHFVLSLSSSLQESRNKHPTTPCHGSSTIPQPDYCPQFKGTTRTLESDVSFMSSSATSSAKSETILLDIPPLLLSYPSTVSPSPPTITPRVIPDTPKKHSPFIPPDLARPSPCGNPASPPPTLSPSIANQPLLNAAPPPLSRRASARGPCTVVESQLLEPVIQPCEATSTTATISTPINQKILTEAEASIEEVAAPLPTYTSKIPAKVKNVIPLKCFLLPLNEDWSVYMKKLVLELLYVPRTVKSRQVLRTCKVEDVKQCSPVMTNQSRLLLLQKLRTVTVIDPSLQDNAGIHAETVPHVRSLRPLLQNDLHTRESTCSTTSRSVDTALITMARSEIEGTKIPVSHPLSPLSHPVLVQGRLGQDEEFLTELELKHGMVVHDIDESDNLPHILVGPVEGIFVFWPGVVIPNKSPEACYASSCQSLQKVWFVSVQHLNIYMECCKVSHASSRAGTVCKVMSALVEDRHQLAQLIADIVHSEVRNRPPYEVCENSSRHQKLLLNMFPCLNPYSVKVILSSVSLIEFLSLDKMSIINKFPWLPENTVADIADVNQTTFQLSQFVNPNQVELMGNAVACYLTQR